MLSGTSNYYCLIYCEVNRWDHEPELRLPDGKTRPCTPIKCGPYQSNDIDHFWNTYAWSAFAFWTALSTAVLHVKFPEWIIYENENEDEPHWKMGTNYRPINRTFDEMGSSPKNSYISAEAKSNMNHIQSLLRPMAKLNVQIYFDVCIGRNTISVCRAST